MYHNIFISTYGSNTIDTLGFLSSITKKISHVKNWTVQGTASLILFFKCLGYTFEGTSKKLKEFKLLNGFVPVSDLIIGNESKKSSLVKKWLEDIITENKIFDKDVQLYQVAKMTAYNPTFLLWDRENCHIKVVSPNLHPTLKLVDVVMGSLCVTGMFSDYEIPNFSDDKTLIAGSLAAIDPYCYKLCDSEKTLYIFNMTNLRESEYTSPFEAIEEELISQHIERCIHKYHLLQPHETSKKVCIHSYYIRGEGKITQLDSLYQNGYNQGLFFLQDKDTKHGIIV